MKTKLLLVILIMILNPFKITAQNTDVWDFGATQLDPTTFNNQLSETIINGFYPSGTVAGSSGVSFPTSFSAGILSWVGNSGDRLRTINTALTRYDANVASVSTYNGRLYCNGTPNLSAGIPTNRFLRMTLTEDDEITVISRTDAAGNLNFVDETVANAQSDIFSVTFASGSVTEAKFVAKKSSTYKIYSADGKASFYRIYRKPAVYTTVSGTIDTSQASGIPAGYSVVFTNAAGKTWTANISSGNYTVTIPVGYTYNLSLVNASGFLISTGDSYNTTGVTTPTVNHNIAISTANLYTVSGTISGLGTTISNLSLTFTPDPSSGSVYVPAPSVNSVNSTYTVQLEPNINYTISATGVNDFNLFPSTLNIPSQNSIANLSFSPKPTFPVTITTTGLDATQQSALQLKFTNLNEPSYNYTFTNLGSIALRNGTYSVSALGLDLYPVELALSSHLVINNSAANKSLTFKPVKVWSFDDQLINSTTTTYYKGMQLNGQITTVTSSGHLTAKPGASILVPVQAGEKVVVNYYYSANFTIDGGSTISTSSNSTNIIESKEQVYTGTTPGNITISVGGVAGSTSYFTEIKTIPNLAYAATLTVGTNKSFQTINDALQAVSYMNRPNLERVTILVDPGNYEEMLDITQPNITIKNASSNPNTQLLNNGVNISANAVRITSYYGHGYSYYSMANNQKWNQQTLAVNQQNGSVSYANVGAGTTNNSYWNATVTVRANGFIADQVIIENSFNQYISTKESQDTVVPWSTGSPGVRPTLVASTTVQNKYYVERAAAIAFANGTDKAILYKCRIVGRQDSFFGGLGARIAIYKGDIMGAVDFIFGGMDAVFYKSNLTMNVSDASNDLSYITAAQQSSGRGFLMYECNINSANPGTETASTYRAKPGYFGRPWLANTSEAVFYNTTIETSNAPGFIGNSLIMPLGWLNTLGGTSAGMYEYGTIEESGVNNAGNRATWATVLSNPTLNDGTAITPFNFTKGNDGWDPFPELIATDASLGNQENLLSSSVKVISVGNMVKISNVKSKIEVKVYAMNGALVKVFHTSRDVDFPLVSGVYIITISGESGRKSVKILST